MRMKITTAGRAKLVNDPNTGTNPVLISHIGLTSTGFTPTAAMTQLPGEFKRMTSFGGKSVAADTIHVTLQDSGAEKYTLRGFGLYLSDGTLFALYGQTDAIMEKASISTLLLSADVVLADFDTAQIKFGSAEFLNPPATTEVAGVVELATESETATGSDTSRGVTPRGLKAALDGRFGANAPTPFVKTLLAMATAAAIRAGLELKSAALKDMGHGKGLDADTLDGMHATDFPQIGKVQTYDAIPGNSNQTRWIKLGTLPWRAAAASILMLEMTNGAIGSPRYSWEQIAASTRTFGETTTVLTQAIVDAMVLHTRLGLSDALDRPSRVGLILTRDAAGKSTGVELWLEQREYNQGHAVRVVNATGATFNGVSTFITTQPEGIIYATPQPVAYMADLQRLVDSTENRWGRRQTFAAGLSLPSEQTVELGSGGGMLRGTDTGSVVMAAGAGATGGFVYLRPNGSASSAGQLVVYKTGSVEMTSARVGVGGDTAAGSVLLEFNTQRPWQFRQLGKDGDTALELFDTSGGKQLRLTNTSNSRAIIFNPSAGLVEAPEFRGMLNGNAVSATKLASARTINGVAFDGTANVVTANWGAQRSIRIGDTAKALNGGADVAWSLTEIGAAALSHNHGIDAIVDLRPALDERIKFVTGDDWQGAHPRSYAAYRGSSPVNGLPSIFSVAVSLPTPDSATGIGVASYYGALQRFWLRGRHDVGGNTPTERWKSWVELWHSANFNPATKADLVGADFTGAVTAPSVKATSNVFTGGAKYAVLAPEGSDGEALLRPNGAGSVVGQLSVTKTGVRWDDKDVWHSGIFNPITKANRIPGQIIMFAGKSAPAGTLICNGAAVSRTTYAELFAAIGTIYGAGDGKSTFNLPAMLDGTVVTHTTTPDSVGAPTAGSVIGHIHGATAASNGAHGHTASTGAAGDHDHSGWTDAQGHHAHTGSTGAAGEHQHPGVVPAAPSLNGYGVYRERDNDALPSEGSTGSAGNHSHAFTTDGAGAHSHSVGTNRSGNHAHSVNVDQGGAHSHAVTVSSTGGERNLPAGLRMIYCITY